jgi:CRP-like cAMP-binding protein
MLQLTHLAQIRTARAGEILASEGDTQTGLVIIKSGRVEIGNGKMKGEHDLNFLSANDYFYPLEKNESPRYSLRAGLEAPVNYLYIVRPDFERWLEGNIQAKEKFSQGRHMQLESNRTKSLMHWLRRKS